jgi:isopenicillin-N epimerase
MRDQFLLNPEIIFLNHGSFGATPKPVFECYQQWQLELERQPVEFIGRRAKGLLETARGELAAYFHTIPENVVYMTNVTVALNAVARSLCLKPGDEVLTTDMEYGALDRTWRFLASKQGFKYINISINLPLTTPEKYVEDFWKGVTPQTRVIFISHLSSPTSVIAPVREICHRARREGILTVVDGAHTPGQVELDLEDMGVDFYGGNLHKWLCAPKGAGFLYAASGVQSLLEPLIVSFGYEADEPGASRLVDYYEYIGTRDLAPFLSVPCAIDFQKKHHWETVRRETHALAADCLAQLTALTGLVPMYAPASNWFAQMVTIPLPPHTDVVSLKTRLYDEFHIEVPMVTWNGAPNVRVSFQAYNTKEDLAALVMALRTSLAF